MNVIDIHSRLAIADVPAVPATPAPDPYLHIDLHGLQLIEASAGTGKTYTLATLVTRLVVERGLRLGQILAVTFTEAATQELRARLRKRMGLAAGIARGIASGVDAPADEPPEASLTRQIIRRQLQHEAPAVLLARLRRAECEIDLAAVFTIHGFCARVLSEHALQTGQAFEPPTLVGSERELHDELAADLWRAHGADPDQVERLLSLWPSPDALARDLPALLRATQLLPQRLAATADPGPQLQHVFEQLCRVFSEHGAQARADLEAAIAAKHIDGRKARSASYEKAWEMLANGVAGSCLARADAHLDKLTPLRLRECAKVGCEDKLPASPLFDALSDWFAADRQRQQWLDAQCIDLLHWIWDDAQERLAELKRTRRLQSFDDLIDDVADALDGPSGESLARQLRAQYAVALVDEFQDTDRRQWAIFRRVFGAPADADSDTGSDIDGDPDIQTSGPSLFLIGDPKQAIYGFRGGDVHTYLDARRDAVEAPPLLHNYRSRPALLRAVAALYAQAGDRAFVDERIAFQTVQPGPGNEDSDYQRLGVAAAALTVRVLPLSEASATWSSPQSREIATAACVAEIHGVLTDARGGHACIDGAPVQPGDIAVLVRSHAEAARMQSALVAAGVPAVAAGKQSLFETEQAGELLALFQALLQPADEGRLRAAMATVLGGVDGAGIDRLDHDDEWRRSMQVRALEWRERWQRHGPLALVAEVCASNAERLLGLLDGERRLTNLMQLGELLQAADARAMGLHGLVDWLRSHIAQADSNDEQQLLRLESDARRVQILTLHKSKGLEFGLVFLPYAGIGKREDPPSRHCQVSTADGCVLHWKPGRDDESQRWPEAVDAWSREQQAEDARLLYVGLTRARHSLWLATGPLYCAGSTALAPMLANLDALRAQGDIVIHEGSLEAALTPLSSPSSGGVPEARRVRRHLSRDWWVYSFTQLSRDDAGEAAGTAGAGAIAGERGAEDEPDLGSTIIEPPDSIGTDATSIDATSIDWRFSGSRFGNVLHEALEHVDFAAWHDWRAGHPAPEGQAALLHAALRAGGYPESALDDGVAELTGLVGQTLTVALPEGGRLCDLPADARRAELEFHFALQPTSIDALLATLHAHGVLPDRHVFGARRQIEGLMTGKIDLTYRAHGRWYLLDYKSNRLPAYDPASLTRAMAHSEYDLQALLYTVALHRWLRFRLGDAYDYARDFGGARYLFCRGLDAGGDSTSGVHAYSPPAELVDSLDRLFSGAGA